MGDTHPEDTEKDNSSAWALKPSVGTWLMPMHAEAQEETALKAHDSSAPAVSEPKVAEVPVAKVARKGLGVRIKTLTQRVRNLRFGCMQPSAAEPKSLKAAAAEPKSLKAPKTSKPAKTVKCKA